MSNLCLRRELLISLAFPILAQAATVELKDGRIYSAEILSQDNERLILNVNGAHVQFPRSMIVSVDEGAKPANEPAKGEIKLLPVTDGPAKVSGTEPATKTVPATHIEISSRKTPQHFHTVIDSLSNDAGIGEARRILGDAGDAGLAVLAEYGVYHDSPLVRTRSVDLLAEMGGQRVLKLLIEAFHSAARPTTEPYQLPYMAALIRNISSLSGTEFQANPPGSGSPGIAAKMEDWWQQHYTKLPPQLGEAALNPGSANYAAKLAAARNLILTRHEFAAAYTPPAVSVSPSTPAAEPPTAIVPPPTIPRNLDQERETSTSQEPAVERPDTTIRDTPGLRRQQEYLEKIREGTKKP